MRKTMWIFGLIACLLLAAGAYFWATGMLDSVYSFRSSLKDDPPAPGEPLGRPLARRVVFVLIDALREDTSLDVQVMPFLNDLRRQGAYATMHSRPPSYSAPGYSVLLTGAWPDVSDGPAFNLEYDDIPVFTQDDLFSAAKRAGLKTALSAYNWFEKLVPQTAVDAGFYTAGEDSAADRAVVDAALEWLRDGSYRFVMVHLDQVDYAGHHEGGPRSDNWKAAAHRVDHLLQEIAAELDLEQDALFVSSDHGQIDAGGHGGHDAITLIEPWVLVGAGVQPGHYGDVEMVDVAPTLAALLGANIPASSQGRVRTEMLALEPAQLAAIESAVLAQQTQLLAKYQAAIGRTAPVEAGRDVVAAHQSAMSEARQARLNLERAPRALLALLAAFLPAALMLNKRGRTLGWMLCAGLLYLLLFNLRYAVIDGRTYSLSSVTGQDELILYVGSTALFALLVSWLVLTAGLKLYRAGSRRAMEVTLGFILAAIYLLSLPVILSYALNGGTVVWTLPDFPSTFLAFISMVQILFVGVLALPLAGAAAVIGNLYTMRSGKPGRYIEEH